MVGFVGFITERDDMGDLLGRRHAAVFLKEFSEVLWELGEVLFVEGAVMLLLRFD